MKWQDLFPEMEATDIHQVIAESWDLESWAYPIPKFTPVCICGSVKWHARVWNVRERYPRHDYEGRVEWRCDTTIKCAQCGVVLTFGIPIPKEYALERQSWHDEPVVVWRRALEIAKEKGYS